MNSYLEIDGWKTNIRFSASHILPGFGKCGKLHGHTYAISIKIQGNKDKNGVIVDFSKVKSSLKEIAEKLDHRIIIAEKDKNITLKDKEIQINLGEKKYIFPRTDCVMLPFESSTAENIAEYVCEQMMKQKILPRTVKKISIGISEGMGQEAWVKRDIS